MKFRSVRTCLLAIAGAGLLALPATAAVPTAAAGLVPSLPAAIPGCACDDERSALVSFQEQIAAAASLDEARALAVSKTSLARRALASARWVAPGSEKIASAHAALVDYEDRVATASTPEEAAWEFGELVQLASLGSPVLGDLDIDVDSGDGCDFSTGEIIAIVLGFLFGIIPGIILLILLC